MKFNEKKLLKKTYFPCLLNLPKENRWTFKYSTDSETTQEKTEKSEKLEKKLIFSRSEAIPWKQKTLEKKNKNKKTPFQQLSSSSRKSEK